MYKLRSVILFCWITFVWTCVHPDEAEVTEGSLQVYTVIPPECSNVVRWSPDNYTLEVLTVNKEPLVRFIVGSAAELVIVLQLVEEEALCGRTVWRTDNSNLFVAVGEDNFLEAVDVVDSYPSTAGVFRVDKTGDAYAFMFTQCEKYSQQKLTEEILKDVAELRSNLSDVREELDNYKVEIARLKQSLSSLQDDLQLSNYELEKLREQVSEEHGDVQVVQSQTISKEEKLLDTWTYCPNYVLFPFDNLFCVIVAVLYVTFSILNTLSNYSSLRLLRSRDQKCFAFYALTQGLTTRYICRSQMLTKKKVDKWLIDIE